MSRDIRDEVVDRILAAGREIGIDLDEDNDQIKLDRLPLDDLIGDFSYEDYQCGERGEELLGSYTPMSSPGTIKLYLNSLRGLFWHSVKDLHQKGYAFWEDDLEKLARLTVGKTYWHEHFHLFTDVQHFLFSGFNKERLKEEALAVAFSLLKISEERDRASSVIGRIANVHYSAFLNILFDYRSPGYQDWRNYSSNETFSDGLLQYVNPPNAGRLLANGIPVHSLLQAQLEKVQEFRKNEIVS